MLQKLLKYDMAYIAKYWWIGMVLSLASSVVGGLLGNLLFHTAQIYDGQNVFHLLVMISSGLAVFVCYLAIILTAFVPTILIITRFYKHFFTDEGYLTFTLPAKRSTLLLSKTVSATFWSVVHKLGLFISILIFFLLIAPGEILSIIRPIIQTTLQTQWDSFGPWLILWDTLRLLEFFVLLVVSSALSIALLHFCIALGSTVVKKAKLILSLSLYYALKSVFVFAYQVILYVFALFMAPGCLVLVEKATPTQNMFIGSLAIWLVISILAVGFFIVYSITQYLLDRRLNLA